MGSEINQSKRAPSIGGFTLIELLTVLVISAIFAALAMPSWSQHIEASQISSATQLLLGTLQLARSEAITRRATVVICRSADANRPSPSCSGTAAGGYDARDWAVGWMVFVKASSNLINTAFEDGDRLLARQPPVGVSAPATARALVWSNAAAPSFTFIDTGLMRGTARTFSIDYAVNPAGYTGVLTSARARQIVINFAGRARISKTP
ncbi:Tfp pilus assembly protein FimT/FimU [soil metagenome]